MRSVLIRALMLTVAAACCVGLLPPGPALGRDATAEQRLADRYAPIVVVRDQSGACDRDGEPYRPTAVETVLGTPGIRLLDDDGSVIMDAPTAQDIAGRGARTSLDFPGNPRRPGCGYERDFDRFGRGQPDVAYAHVARDATAPGKIALQYWFFWYFDDYVNTHEGDWEFIQIVFPADSAAQALTTPPLEVGYSQHSGGERASWDDAKLVRQGDHPLVYAAAGSHANFFSSELFLGRSADEGFGCDNTTGPSTRLRMQARLLPAAAPDPSGPLAWLLFEGRWGEFQPSPYDAPAGPRTKEEWASPIVWQDSLRDGSFAIPAGTVLGPTATGAFCSVVKAGGRVYTAVTSPWSLALMMLGIVGVGGVGVRVTRWSPPVPTPVRRRRSSGQMLREALALWRRHSRLMLGLGALFIAAAILESLAQGLVLAVTPLGSLVDTAGHDSLASAVIALLVGGAGHLVASAVVLGGVAAALGRLESRRPARPRDVYRLIGRRLPTILGILLVTTAVMVGLSLTVVGLPIAILLIVRWAVAQQAAMLEGLGVRAALARSRALTRGRWWRTARLALTVNVVGAVSGPFVGIVLLFVSGLPLGAINAVSSLVFAATIPFVGAAMALLYGDLVARERDDAGTQAR